MCPRFEALIIRINNENETHVQAYFLYYPMKYPEKCQGEGNVNDATTDRRNRSLTFLEALAQSPLWIVLNITLQLDISHFHKLM